MDILGLGVLIIGDSGIGKSECALDLVVRGHRLVADDTVEVRRRGEKGVIGTCPELTRHHMEVRGLGVINIRDLFGVASTRRPSASSWWSARALGSRARVRSPRARRERLRAVRREDAAHPHAGRAGTQPRDPRRSGGPEPDAAVARASTPRAISRRGSSSNCARPRPKPMRTRMSSLERTHDGGGVAARRTSAPARPRQRRRRGCRTTHGASSS